VARNTPCQLADKPLFFLQIWSCNDINEANHSWNYWIKSMSNKKLSNFLFLSFYWAFEGKQKIMYLFNNETKLCGIIESDFMLWQVITKLLTSTGSLEIGYSFPKGGHSHLPLCLWWVPMLMVSPYAYGESTFTLISQGLLLSFVCLLNKYPDDMWWR
jgi:hypothetical protein